MEENVALDSKKQKKFVKSIRGIKKLIKKNEKKPEIQKKEEATPNKTFSMRIKDDKIKKRRKPRGLVYLSHIPHGFYEHQMTQYFKQFGVVTNARVIRSKRTGNSKGFAFVEFKEPAVGQIVAETMNNYLMGKRLIKAAYIPPEKQKRKAFRKHWNSIHNPGSQQRLKMKKAFNADKDENGEIKRARKLLSNLSKTKIKLGELGISYDFFQPVDVPQALLNQDIKQESVDNNEKEQLVETRSKKAVKGKLDIADDKNVKETASVDANKKKNKIQNKLNELNKPVKNENASENKNKNLPVKVNEKQQNEKKRSLKNAGVKPMEEFIKIKEDSGGDSDDSSYNFDSDEYENVLEHEDSSDLSSDETGESGHSGDGGDGVSGEDDSNDESESEILSPKMIKVGQVAQTKKQIKKQPQIPQAKKQIRQTPPLEVKRKAPLRSAVTQKKTKFEKQNQKQVKKQFKKK